MELIDQSFKLDLVNKKIICSLSLRGEEKHFLTSNYSQFLKILEQQVKQYSTQLSIKELIIQAVGDLPPERLANEKSGFRKQEEWYLTIEGLLSEIIDLGDRKEDLDYHNSFIPDF
jgi:hypothetical protein